MKIFIKDNFETISRYNSTIYNQTQPYFYGLNNSPNDNKINTKNGQIKSNDKISNTNNIFPPISNNPDKGYKLRSNLKQKKEYAISNGNSKSVNKKNYKSKDKHYNSRYIDNFRLTNRK